MECLHNSSEASGGDYKCREKKRMYLRINRAQDAYASYSIESRVKVIPRYVELPCERILLNSPYSSREKKRKTLPSQIFLSKTFNFVISSKLNFSKLNYLFWKRSNFHNKKKKKENWNSFHKNFHKISTHVAQSIMLTPFASQQIPTIPFPSRPLI